MKVVSLTDAIINRIRQDGVVTSDDIARELRINTTTAAGMLTQLRIKNKVVYGKGLWALNNTELAQADKYLKRKKACARELTSILNSMIRSEHERA